MIRLTPRTLLSGAFVAIIAAIGVWCLESGEPPPQPAAPQPVPISFPPPISRSADTPAAAADARATRQAETASPVVVSGRESGMDMVIMKNDQTYPLRIYKPMLAPNDPYASQWWGAATGIDSVWNNSAGARQTTVAVIDTGFALSHEEFSGRWAVNASEQGSTAQEAPSQLNCTDQGLPLDMSCNLIDDNHDGIVDNETGSTTKENPSRLNCTDRGQPRDRACNRLDDDGNGFIDDVTGWDFVSGDNSVQAGEINPNGQSTAHGTEVAGILAATGDNGKGIAGIDWSARVLPLQAINDDGYGDTLTVANAVIYAASRGADIINLSLGATEEDPYLRLAIQAAIDKGSIVIAASGNDGCDCITYPARYPEVVAVGAENSHGGPAAFSNYGNSLTLLAPGTDMTTATWHQANPSTAYVSGVAGTSFAAPYVSGLLSLARSHQPNASWGELLNALLAEASHTGLSPAVPTSPMLGSGYAHAGRFIGRVTTSSKPLLRYEFGPLSHTDSLGSSHAYQCETNDFPTALVYELTSGSRVRYTISPLEQTRAAASGWSATPLWYACVGMPGDTPTVIRSLNLLNEIKTGVPSKRN